MKKGFTLIELLVVVSIISLLSSIVFGSLSGARVKAKNSVIVQQYQQYEKAFWLHYYEYGTLPTPSVSNIVCLSDTDDNGCGPNGSVPEDAQLSSQVERYMSVRPSTNPIQVSATQVWQGYLYWKPSIGTSVKVYYYLHGNAQCAAGYETPYYVSSSDVTYCVHRLYE